MEEFIACFAEVSDPRQKNVRHNLYEVRIIALCTMLCGGEDCSDMEVFGRPKLLAMLSLKGGIVTADAMGKAGQRFHQAQPDGMARRGCQRAIGAQIVEQGAD